MLACVGEPEPLHHTYQGVAMFRLLALVGLLAAMLAGLPLRSSAATVDAVPAGACRWLVAPGGVGTYRTVFADLDQTPLADLHFGEPYAPARFRGAGYSNQIAGYGFLDFDADDRADAFRVRPRPDGLWQWQYLPGSSDGWADLNYASPPLANLRFGDFDGDGRTDVFTTIASAGGYQWLVSSAGLGSFQLLRSDPLGASDLRLGDFNGDGRTDIFGVAPRPDGLYQWRYASAGSGPWVDLNEAAQSLSELRLSLFGVGRDIAVLTLRCTQYPTVAIPTSSARLVLGQADFRDRQPNRGAAVAADTTAGPAGLLVTPDGKRFVADYHNSRVLIWQSVQGLVSGQPADLALGQADLQSGQDPEIARSCVLPTAATLCGPEALAYDARGNGTLYVADTVNSRVLAYHGPFTAANRAAVRVYGQADMVGGDQNRGNVAQLDANTLNYPRGLAFDPVDRRLFVADDFNHRVLVFVVDDGDTQADQVLGFPDFTNGQPATYSNDMCAGAITSRTMCSPKGLAYDAISNTQYVADYAYHRVLQFRGPFTESNQPARLAFGQIQGAGNLTSGESTCQYGGDDKLKTPQHGPIAADRFCNPLDLALAPNGALLVADATNSRVLLFSDPLSADPVVTLAPDAVYGQRGSFSSGEKNQPDPPGVPTSETLYRPMGMAFFQGALYLSDFDNNRVLRFRVGAGLTVYLPLAVRS
jgi:DNA-binding beta-propeller fold protein YncE